MHVDLDGMALFVGIVEAGSLSAAGRVLDLPKATVSRRLLAMEKRLGVALLHRSTRSLTLTDPGRQYYERIAPIVREAHAAESEALSWQAAPSGILRVSATESFGLLRLGPLLYAFADLYPDVRIDLRLTDRRLNLVAEGIDLAIRMGDLEDSELASRLLTTLPRMIVASPNYLDRRGIPVRAEDFAAHQIIVSDPAVRSWRLGGQDIRIVWRFSSGNMLATRDAARAGLGVAMVPSFLVTKDIASGSLVAVLPDCDLPVAHATALYPKTVEPSPALRALIDHLVLHLGTGSC